MRTTILAIASLLTAVAPACKRSGGEGEVAEVTVRVDGVAIDPVRLHHGETVVVAGGGHGDPSWVSARGRGSDGRFVSAALQRYPQGQLRMTWPAGETTPTLSFHDGAGEDAHRLSLARGVEVIDLLTAKPVAAAAPRKRAELVISGPGEQTHTISADVIEELEASSIQTGQRRGAALVDLIGRIGIDPKTIGEVRLEQPSGKPVLIPGPALRAANEMVIVRFNKRGELRIFHERAGNTVVDARNVTRLTLSAR